MNSTTTVKDPVCGMDVETNNAAGQTNHAGQIYYFCSSICKAKFDKDPAHYLGKPAGMSKGDHDCCG